MDSAGLTVPVALFIFKRPEITELVFNMIRSVRPSRLLVVADGPRPDQPGEKELCEATRRVVDKVDWKCEVSTQFSPVNLGLNHRLTSGLDWVFSQVEEAIILEDDCLPHPSFFRFCQELLTKYRHDQRIMMVSGNNFQEGPARTESSYYFSRIFHIWGWATWRRAWKHYDDSLKLWPEFGSKGWLNSITADPNAQRFFHKMFQDHLEGRHILSWDYRWNLSCWLQNGISIMPNVNLVSNVGFGHAATYAHNSDSTVSNIPVKEMAFPLIHPDFVLPDPVADQQTMEKQFYLPVPEAVPIAPVNPQEAQLLKRNKEAPRRYHRARKVRNRRAELRSLRRTRRRRAERRGNARVRAKARRSGRARRNAVRQSSRRRRAA